MVLIMKKVKALKAVSVKRTELKMTQRSHKRHIIRDTKILSTNLKTKLRQVSVDKHSSPEVSQEEVEALSITKIIIVIVHGFKPKETPGPRGLKHKFYQISQVKEFQEEREFERGTEDP